MKNSFFIPALKIIALISFVIGLSTNVFSQSSNPGFKAAIKKARKDGCRFTLAWEKQFHNLLGEEVSTHWADKLDQRGSFLMILPNKDALILFDVRSRPQDIPWNMYMAKDGRNAYQTSMRIQETTFVNPGSKTYTLVIFTRSEKPYAYSSYLDELSDQFTGRDLIRYIVVEK